MGYGKKKWWESKMLWFNVLTGLASMLPQVREMVPADKVPYVVLAIAAVNVALRAITGKPISP